MNRCMGFTKNNKRCRAKINIQDGQDGQYEKKYFCCESHEQINKDIIGNQCFMCMDIISDIKQFVIFRCKHMFHKECYYEWSKFSGESENICMICRTPILHSKPLQPMYKLPIKYKFYNKTVAFENILFILNNSNMMKL